METNIPQSTCQTLSVSIVESKIQTQSTHTQLHYHSPIIYLTRILTGGRPFVTGHVIGHVTDHVTGIPQCPVVDHVAKGRDQIPGVVPSCFQMGIFDVFVHRVQKSYRHMASRNLRTTLGLRCIKHASSMTIICDPTVHPCLDSNQGLLYKNTSGPLFHMLH